MRADLIQNFDSKDLMRFAVKSKHWFVKSGYFNELNNLLSPCP